MLEQILREGVPLSRFTSMRVGGPARYFAEGRTVDELRACLEWAAARGLRVQVLGGGSNTLFADQGYDGLVLKVGVRGAQFPAAGGREEVRAGGGEEWDDLVRQCCERGLAGLECLSGIPGSVGATPVQNVGAYGQEVAQTVATVEALDRRTLEPVALRGEACGFGYRTSRFKTVDQGRYLITAVRYRLAPQGRPEVRYAELQRYLEEGAGPVGLAPGREGLLVVREAVLELRRRKSMLLDPDDPDACSVGSFFLNPVLDNAGLDALRQRWLALGRPGDVPVFGTPDGGKVAAAWLVEQAGFAKGYRRGRAGISSHHALALVNRGGTAEEVLALAGQVEERVQAVFGVRLEREPAVVPYQ